MQGKIGDGVYLTGTLPRDAETKYTNSGKTVVEFGTKVGDREVDGEKKAIWANCVAFGRVADMASTLRKGDVVLVTGKLKVDSYTNRNGEPATSTKVICEYISKMGDTPPNVVPTPPPVGTAETSFMPISDDDDLPF